MNIIECGQYNDLKKLYLRQKADYEMMRADKHYYLRITREATVVLASQLNKELNEPKPNIPHCQRILDELETATDMLTFLESLS